MYYEHFHLKEHPFRLTTDIRFFYESPEHAHAMGMMEFALIKKHGLMLLTGDSGLGKSMVLENFLARIDKTYPVIRFRFKSVTEIDFLQHLAKELTGSVVEEQSRRLLLETIHTQLKAQHQQGKKPVMVLDDAQKYEPAIIKDLSEVAQWQEEGVVLCTIYLVGNNELQNVYNQVATAAPCCQYQIKQLPAKEIQGYIMHRLNTAGGHGNIEFDDEVFEIIETYTGGSPRQINILVDHMLTGAYLAEEQRITAKIAEAALNELQWLPHGLPTLTTELTDDNNAPFLTDRRQSYMIVITANNQPKREFFIRDKRVTIGRHRTNDISIDDPLISRVHAEIIRQGRIYYVRDLNSKNGTFIDNRRIDIAPIHEHTRVRVGDCLLTFIRKEKAHESAA